MQSKTVDGNLTVSIYLSIHLTGRKEDETDEKWIEKERERGKQEREREERGKETQMLIYCFFCPCITPTSSIMSDCTRKEHGLRPEFKSTNR